MIMLYFDSTLPYEPWGSFIPLEPQIHFYDLGISETGKKKCFNCDDLSNKRCDCDHT